MLSNRTDPTAIHTAGSRRNEETPTPAPRLVADTEAGDGGPQRQLIGQCENTCFGYSCDDWEAREVPNYWTCVENEADGCDCTGCECTGGTGGGGGSGLCPESCFGADCTYWMEVDGDTCAELESIYGCDCTGCECTGGTGGGGGSGLCPDTCFEMTCDEWENLDPPFTCAENEAGGWRHTGVTWGSQDWGTRRETGGHLRPCQNWIT